jgi:hypothetical protein
MSEPVNDLVALALANGAVFKQSPTGTWTAHRNDTPGIWGMSQVDAAARFLEEIGVEPTTPGEILAHICHQYRPYDTLPAFQEGFEAAPGSRSPYEEAGTLGQSVSGQAWDRGANAAMLYARALAFLDVALEKPDPASPGWLQRLLRMGRC